MRKFEELTQYEIDLICNGCGGKGVVIRPPFYIFFHASCNKHDYSYWLGCTEEDRLKADKGFLRVMLSDCDKLNFIGRVKYKTWAYLYYYAVRTFGWQYFYYANEQRNEEHLRRAEIMTHIANRVDS